MDVAVAATDADGRRSKFLVQETRTRILVQDICNVS